MVSGKAGAWLVNVATGTVTLAAVLVATIRIREWSDAGNYANESWPTRVGNWRQYGAEGVRLGPTIAAVTIVEFSDFRCPACRRAADDLRAVRAKYPGDVAVIYRHFPHYESAHNAGVAAECASRFHAFEKFHDVLFERPDSIGRWPWTRFAIAAGIADLPKFETCMRDSSAQAIVTRDSAAAVALGALGTPALLVN